MTEVYIFHLFLFSLWVLHLLPFFFVDGTGLCLSK